MKSLSILILVTLAAFASGAHASQPKGDITTLPREIHSEMAHRFTDASLKAYASASRGSKKAVEDYREDKLISRLQPILTRLNIKMDSSIVKSLIAARTLGARSHTPLDRFIIKTGLDNLNKNPALAQELARITVPLATGLSDAIVVADPHSLLQLARITGQSDSIKALFEQNAALFNNGLGIDETWLDDGLLDWFLSSIDPNNALSALHLVLPYIRYSYKDISRIFCSSIFSVLDPKASASSNYAKISKQMWQPISLIWATYVKHKVSLPEEVLEMRNTGQLVRIPKPFNLKMGISVCFKKHPNVFALVAGVNLLFGKAISNQDRELHSANIVQAIQSTMNIVDVDTEDLWWLLLSHQLPGSSYSELLDYALKNTKNGIQCSMQSGFIRKLYEQGRYKDAVKLMNVSSKLHPSSLSYLTSELTAAASGAKISKAAHNMLLENFS